MPWRKTVLVDMETGEIVDKGPPENWKVLPRLKQTRRAGSARMSITSFGVLKPNLVFVNLQTSNAWGVRVVVDVGALKEYWVVI